MDKMKTILKRFNCAHVLTLLMISFSAAAQYGIEITTGGSITLISTATIEIANGGLINNGTYTKGSETVTFSGTTAKTISGTSNTSMHNLSVTNTGGITSQVGLLTTNDLTIAAGCAFKVDYAKAVTVSGTLTNTPGTSGLVVKSDATGTGSLIHSTASVNGTFERYINNADWTNWYDGWHFLSSPVASHAISPNFVTDPFDIYCWYEPANTWVNYKNTTTAPTWNTANGSTNFNLGKGYLVEYDEASTKSFAGVLNVSDVSVTGLTITGTSQANRSWHLLGNPFGSAITWDASTAWGFVNIAGVAKIWNEVNQSYSDLTSSPATVIPATNGFMVQVSTGTGSLTIPEDKRTHSAQPFFKSATSAIKLTAYNIDAGNAQESMVSFNPLATEGFDLMYDGEYLPGYGPEFHSAAGNVNLSTNNLPELTTSTTIPFAFKPNTGTAFRIKAEGTESISLTTWMLDKQTNTDHNLSLEPTFQFTASAADPAERFLLHFGGAYGIPQQTDQPEFALYAIDNSIFIKNLSGHSHTGFVTIYNTIGQVVYEKNITDQTTVIQPGIPSGFYIVTLVANKRVYSIKVLMNLW